MKLKRLLFPLLTLLIVLLLIPRAQAEEVATSAKACIIIDEASGRVLLSPADGIHHEGDDGAAGD
mgnify:CR=1 FL=1